MLGYSVINQGRPSGALFIVVAGRLNAIHSDSDGKRVLATLVPGDIFGEMSLLNHEPSLASVTADGKCWVVALPEPTFRSMIEGHAELAALIARIAEERQQANWNTLRDPSRNFSDDRSGAVGMI